MCEHTDSAGQPKLVGTCDFEVTAPGCVDTVVTGARERGVDTTLAPRLRSLRGLLDKAKPNGSVLLSHTGRNFAASTASGVSAVVETFGPRGGPPSVARVG